MFTGIIETMGTLVELRRQGEDVVLTVEAPGLDFSDVKLGDSIATNGVCLTVVTLGDKRYSADVSLETLSRSGFAQARVGDRVNLEKALTPSSRLGGHLVSGHVDGVGEVKSKSSSGRAIEYWVKAPAELSRYIAEKGSIAVDGISLTVNAVKGDDFRLTIVPHTAQETTIANWKPGHRVNLEVDQIARYLERLLQGGAQGRQGAPASNLTLEKLAQSGFL
ncbi:riboflavin synthase [Aeromonas rivuli]|jgi:riboflavin synthase|uniref:riboflavin synthase n=1 Tax=Aeromonas TaxID=642 RepID=UPI0005A901CC|nr:MULTISPECIES: riboflavin synthase [Aeromonas]MCS3454770.1 riboflavin synthase [Aeromonas sp. BIGb0405]UBO75001.1 riboflavin synthase [Aeromonas rivuli]